MLFDLAEVWFDIPGKIMNKIVAVDTRPKPVPWCLLPVDLYSAEESDPLIKALRSGSVCAN